VRDYREAELLFGSRNPKGTSIAIYGRARALTEAGRCAAARVAYEEYAQLVGGVDPVAAERARAYANDCREETESPGGPASTNVASMLISGDYPIALEIAAEARPEEASPWLDYNRGVALGELGKTDEAVAAFVAAERAFGDDEAGHHGRAVAIYGRGRALARAGRCAEARRACEEYATFTGSDRDRCRRC
jgi:tetratricopeptide (TPR) repeat protein